ncbi:MAG: MFS transporter [Peptococcaceae bacterium]|jgi:MFS family permease|nr:MFS transporter [Peptococcaceae bacterium]
MPSEPKLFNRDYLLALSLNAVAFFSFHILTPLIPVFGMSFTRHEAALGFLASAISIAALLSRPFTGPLADRGNRKLLIAFSQLGIAVIISLLILSQSVGVLILLRFLHGALFSIVSTTVTATIIDTIPESRLGQGISIMGITTMGGQAVAPVFGIFLSRRFGFGAMFTVTAIISALAAIPAFIIQPKPRPSAKPGKIGLKNIIALESAGVATISLTFSMITAAITSFMVVFGNERGILNIGLYFTIYAIGIVLCRLVGGRVTDKYPYQCIVYASTVLCVAALILIGGAHTFLPIAIAGVLLSLGVGFAVPALQTEGVRRVTPERRGVATATYYIALDIANISSPLIIGFVALTAGYGVGFYLLCVPVSLAFAVLLLNSAT